MNDARWKIALMTQKLDHVFNAYQNNLLAKGRRSQRILLISGLIGLILSGGIAILVQGHISARLGIVTDSARRIRGGNLDFRIDIKDSDGLGVLANEFNSMAETLAVREKKLAEQMDKINDLNKHLKW